MWRQSDVTNDHKCQGDYSEPKWYTISLIYYSQIIIIWRVRWEVTVTIGLWRLTKRRCNETTVRLSCDRRLQFPLRNHYEHYIVMDYLMKSQWSHAVTLEWPTFGDSTVRSKWVQLFDKSSDDFILKLYGDSSHKSNHRGDFIPYENSS